MEPLRARGHARRLERRLHPHRAGEEPVARTQWQLFRRRFMHHKLAVFGLIVLAVLTIMCFFPALFARGHHAGFDISTALSGAKGPTAKHWLGTDEQGQDFYYVLLKS